MQNLWQLAGIGCIMLVGVPAMTQTLTGLPEHGLTLSGDPNHPIFQNNSNRRVVIYALRAQVMRDGQTITGTIVRDSLLSLRNNAFLAKKGNPTPNQPDMRVAPGANQNIQLSDSERGQAVLSLSIDGAIFDDGEFVGPDAGSVFDHISATIRGERDVHEGVLRDHAAGVDPWVKVRAIAAMDQKSINGTGPQRLYMMKQLLAAQELLSVLQASGGGAASALDLARSSQVYPTLRRKQ